MHDDDPEGDYFDVNFGEGSGENNFPLPQIGSEAGPVLGRLRVEIPEDGGPPRVEIIPEGEEHGISLEMSPVGSEHQEEILLGPNGFSASGGEHCRRCGAKFGMFWLDVSKQLGVPGPICATCSGEWRLQCRKCRRAFDAKRIGILEGLREVCPRCGHHGMKPLGPDDPTPTEIGPYRRPGRPFGAYEIPVAIISLIILSCALLPKLYKFLESIKARDNKTGPVMRLVVEEKIEKPSKTKKSTEPITLSPEREWR